jgi:hypothetical protein
VCEFVIIVQPNVFKALFFAHGWVNGDRCWALEVGTLAR